VASWRKKEFEPIKISKNVVVFRDRVGGAGCTVYLVSSRDTLLKSFNE
jgi:hypothetical protein